MSRRGRPFISTRIRRACSPIFDQPAMRGSALPSTQSTSGRRSCGSLRRSWYRGEPTMGQLPSAAVRTLVRAAEALEAARDDWWLIGGAAVALQGLAIEIADVDVLLSAHDARQVIATL